MFIEISFMQKSGVIITVSGQLEDAWADKQILSVYQLGKLSKETLVDLLALMDYNTDPGPLGMMTKSIRY